MNISDTSLLKNNDLMMLCVWSFFGVFEGGSGVLHAAGNINTLMMFVNCFIVCSIQFCGV